VMPSAHVLEQISYAKACAAASMTVLESSPDAPAPPMDVPAPTIVVSAFK